MSASATRPVAQAKHPPAVRTLRVTLEGWYWLFASVALGATGLVRGINLITLLGCLMLASWGLHWVSSRRRLRRLRGRHWLDEPIFAGTPFRLRAEIHNPERTAAIGLVLEDQGSDDSARWIIPTLAGGATGQYRQSLLCRRRGRHTVGPLVVSTRLPFGLLVRAVQLVREEEIIVLPQLGHLQRGRLRRLLAWSATAAGRSGPHARRHPAAQADLHGLRPFRSGDSPRWIHWRTTARRGELMVREFEEAPTDNLILVLDPTLPSGADPSLFEDAVGLAATICWEWCRQTGDHLVLAVPGSPPALLSGVTGRDFALRLLRCLAVQSAAPAVDAAALAEQLAAAGLPTAPVLVVGAEPAELRDVLNQGLHRRVIALAMSDPQVDDLFERADDHAR